MDWVGQKLSETLMQVMLVVSAIVAFSTGYILASFRLMLLVYLGGVVLTTLVTVPNWPFFNRHPLKWLEPSEAERHPRPQLTSNLPIGKKKGGKQNPK
ncbi:putative Signal peptidase complex subunit [Zostera marina]|uniref:Signal peptidase complex subunit 1 n=1 Tax=Zostera marina TaxID=29655 RepID=A0A0K9PVC8_ZOSMR|nr:putative Signal peptidase complex subunit [Zostera marina]